MKSLNTILAAGAICGATFAPAMAATVWTPPAVPYLQGSFVPIDKSNDLVALDINFKYHIWQNTSGNPNSFYLAIVNYGETKTDAPTATSLAFDFGNSTTLTNASATHVDFYSLGSSLGVKFTNVGSGYNLPEGNTISFTTDLAYTGDPPPSKNGVDPFGPNGNSEVLFVTFDVTGVTTLQGLAEKIASKTDPLRFGMHIQETGPNKEGSLSVINTQTFTVVPEPTTVSLSLLGLSALLLRRKRRA